MFKREHLSHDPLNTLYMPSHLIIIAFGPRNQFMSQYEMHLSFGVPALIPAALSLI